MKTPTWWTKIADPLAFFDRWFAALEGDDDAAIIVRAQTLVIDDEKSTEVPIPDANISEQSKPKSVTHANVGLLPAGAFYSTPFNAPTKSPSEARKIAMLQLDRLTAIPPQDALIAIGGPSQTNEDGQSQFELFVTKKSVLTELRNANQNTAGIEAFVAFGERGAGGGLPVAGVFRDQLGLLCRARRRIATGFLLVGCAAMTCVMVWSLEQRVDRVHADVISATREAEKAKTKVVEQRAKTLAELSVFSQGATGASADRVLVTLHDITGRAPVDVRLQMIEIAQGKVRLRGFAKDPNAAKTAFSTPFQASAGPANAGSVTTPPPTVGVAVPPNMGFPTPVNPSVSGSPAPIQTNDNPWQGFELEVQAPVLRVSSTAPVLTPTDDMPGAPVTSNGAPAVWQP